MATPTRAELIEQGAEALGAAARNANYNKDTARIFAEIGKAYAFLAQAAPADVVQAKGPATPGFQDTVNRHGGV